MTAVSSMPWLVVCASPPDTTTSSAPSTTRADQPPLTRLLLAPLQTSLGLAGFGGEALLELHQAEDLFFTTRLLLLDALDLGEDRGVLDVVLDLPQAGLGLGALRGDDLEVLFLAPEVLPGRVGFLLEQVQRGLGFGDGGVDGFDLLGEAGGVGLERGDPRVEALQVDQRQEL